MGDDTRVLSAAIEEDSKLSEEFDEFQSERGHISKSEAVRALLRSGLENERQSTERDPSKSQDVELNLLDGNMTLIFGIAFLLGSNTILQNLQAILPEPWGTAVFAAIGLGIIIGLLPVWVREFKKIVNQLRSRDVDKSTGEPRSSG